MKKIPFILLIFFTFYFTGQATAADKVYVTDAFTITLRTGPSINNKIINLLKSGQALQVIETQEKWSHVEVLEDNGGTEDGWVRNQYLIDRIPYKDQVDKLTTENGMLNKNLSSVSEQLSSIKKQKEDLSTEFSKAQGELNTLKNNYESLKKSSSEYLKLKAEYGSNLSKLKSAEQRLKELEIENAKIKGSQNYLWFGTGALVLLFGLIIGSILGRQSRKKASSYYL